MLGLVTPSWLCPHPFPHPLLSIQVWFYKDPAGLQQGPCSISQFRTWLSHMSQREDLSAQYEQFKAVDVWTSDNPRRIPLVQLLPEYRGKGPAGGRG